LSKVMNSREWLVNRLDENLSANERRSRIQKILVLGGGIDEPELMLFEKSGVEIHYAGIAQDSLDEKFHFIDLDNFKETNMTFDLVICNQVLEHLYNLENAFKYFDSLVRKNGMIWITCPANNFRHGSPFYYSAGYSREFLEMKLSHRGFVSIDVGELSSRRIYLFRHLLGLWPTTKQVRFPLIAYFGFNGTALQKIAFNIKTIGSRIVIGFSSKRWEVNGNFPLETYGFFEKKVDF